MSVIQCRKKINHAPPLLPPPPSLPPSLLTAAGGVLSQGKKVDFDTVPQIRGQSIFEFNLEVAADKPWRMPGDPMHHTLGEGGGGGGGGGA